MSSRVITRCCPPSGTEPGDGASAEPAAGDELAIADGDLAADVHGRAGPDAWLERGHGQRRLRQREPRPGEPVLGGLRVTSHWRVPPLPGRCGPRRACRRPTV